MFVSLHPDGQITADISMPYLTLNWLEQIFIFLLDVEELYCDPEMFLDIGIHILK